MSSERVVIKGSERPAPNASPLGPADPDDVAVVSVYLKRPEAAEPGSLSVIGRAALQHQREQAMTAPAQTVEDFAKTYQLNIVERDLVRRLIRLSGRVKDLESAFGTKLQRFQHASGPFRGRSGALSAPAEVADAVEAVLGLDQRRVATPKSIRLDLAAAPGAHLPNAITRLYGFPAGLGQGECIAIIELGGGVSDADTKRAFAAMNLSPPEVIAISVGAGSNAPGEDPDADGEVALDVQVAGAGASGARLAVYFAPNTDQGFVDAISQAVHDSAHGPSVMSISWGSAEDTWTAQAVAAMTSAFQDAAQVGVSVFAASGDGLATDGQTGAMAHVDFPASSPWVVGCGGTRLQASGSVLVGETVWNSHGGGTGGGISALFTPPEYQSAVKLPPSANKGAPPGRGVPDVASDADPDTGYQVVVGGEVQAIGGTSAAAPLWSGLFALINQARARPVGQPHAVLYANPSAFHDVVSGDNRSNGIGYSAGPGWDACTGLGSPKGSVVAGLFG